MNSKQVAVLDKAIFPQTVVNERPLATVRQGLVYGEDGSVSFRAGSDINVYEVISLVNEDINTVKSAGVRAANTLRLARQLPAVKVAVGGGSAKLETKLVPAYDFALEKVRETVKDKTLYNVLELVTCLDIKDKNNFASGPFAIKEALGALGKLGLIKADSKVSGSNAIVKALKSGTGANALRPVIAKVKEANPTKFAAKATSAKPATAVKADDTADKLSMDLAIIVGRWDKLAAVNMQSVRNACSDKIRQLATLAGFKVELIEPAKSSGVSPEKTLEAMKPAGKK